MSRIWDAIEFDTRAVGERVRAAGDELRVVIVYRVIDRHTFDVISGNQDVQDLHQHQRLIVDVDSDVIDDCADIGFVCEQVDDDLLDLPDFAFVEFASKRNGVLDLSLESVDLSLDDEQVLDVSHRELHVVQHVYIDVDIASDVRDFISNALDFAAKVYGRLLNLVDADLDDLECRIDPRFDFGVVAHEAFMDRNVIAEIVFRDFSDEGLIQRNLIREVEVRDACVDDVVVIMARDSSVNGHLDRGVRVVIVGPQDVADDGTERRVLDRIEVERVNLGMDELDERREGFRVAEVRDFILGDCLDLVVRDLLFATRIDRVS